MSIVGILLGSSLHQSLLLENWVACLDARPQQLFVRLEILPVLTLR